MGNKLTIGVLFGGLSGEHEVSLNSAQSIINALDKNKYDVFPIAISKNGDWYGPIEFDKIASFTPTENDEKQITILPMPSSRGRIFSRNNLTEPIKNIDVFFPVLHGTNGEDGTIQGLFEMADVAYVGNGVAASAVGMDKGLMKDVFKTSQLPQTEYLIVPSYKINSNIKEVVDEIKAKLQLPLFIKPVNLGSSVGISKVKTFDQLEEALLKAAKFDVKVIIEEGLNVREIEASVLGNHQPQASILGEIVPCNEFYDYKAKYIDNKSALIMPAELDEKTTEEIRELAVRAFKAIGGEGLARVDFFVEKETGKVLINEINTLPGFTSISMYPKLWEHTGITMSNLLDKLIYLALERYQEKTNLVRSYEE